MFPSEEGEAGLPIFAAFSDLLACVLGIFVLFFVWVVGFEVHMAGELAHERSALETERSAREQAQARVQRLETALAGPLREGLITFVDGTIGIRGNVLFDLNSAQLNASGEQLLRELAGPLASYLGPRDEELMVSGFTDSLPIHSGPKSAYRNNMHLSCERAQTVVSSLIDAGVSAERVFTACHGEYHPIAPNDSDANRAKNRRVELSPVPKSRRLQTFLGGS
jgi:flagellar motor protein MotB